MITLIIVLCLSIGAAFRSNAMIKKADSYVDYYHSVNDRSKVDFYLAARSRSVNASAISFAVMLISGYCIIGTLEFASL